MKDTHSRLKIISGGQTGADRAALDAAIKLNVPHGGWCPAGRKAVDGPIDDCYDLKETPSPGYLERNRWNVRDSDGTAIFTLAAKIEGGSLKTQEFCIKQNKPYLHLHPDMPGDPVEALRDFIGAYSISTLNVAGSRAEREPGLYSYTKQIIEHLLD